MPTIDRVIRNDDGSLPAEDGRRERAVTIPAKRGAGSYRRKTKYARID